MSRPCTSGRARADGARSRTLPARDSVDLGLPVTAVCDQLAHHNGGEDDTGEDRETERGVGGIVPGHPLLEDAQRDGGRGDHGELDEVPESHGRQRRDERGEPVRRVEREPEDGGLEEDADERQDARHHPGHGLEPPDRDAQHGRAVAPVAGGLDRDSRCRSG